MTPVQAKRAAFLLKARIDLIFELDVPESDRDKDRSEYEATHLNHMEADAWFKLEIVDA